MKMMIVLVVIVALVGKTIAGAAPGTVETLIEHQDVALIESTEELLEQLDEVVVVSSKRGAPVSETVASLLYATEDKYRTKTYFGVTVARLIEQNTVQLGDCSLQGFKERVDVINSLRPADETKLKVRGGIFAVNVYALRCLHLATEYCVRNQADVIDKNINDDKFMAMLQRVLLFDTSPPKTDESVTEEAVYNNEKTYVQAFIEDQL